MMQVVLVLEACDGSLQGWALRERPAGTTPYSFAHSTLKWVPRRRLCTKCTATTACQLAA